MDEVLGGEGRGATGHGDSLFKKPSLGEMLSQTSDTYIHWRIFSARSYRTVDLITVNDPGGGDFLKPFHRAKTRRRSLYRPFLFNSPEWIWMSFQWRGKYHNDVDRYNWPPVTPISLVANDTPEQFGNSGVKREREKWDDFCAVLIRCVFNGMNVYRKSQWRTEVRIVWSG